MKDFSQIVQPLKAVANKRRLEILSSLRGQAMTVGEIAKAIHLSLRSTSKHLQILRAAGIVEYSKRGLFVAYRVSLDQEEITKGVLRAL